MLINVIGAFFWSLLAINHFAAFFKGNLVSAFLAVQSGLAAVLLIFRRMPANDSNKLQQIVSWTSALLPLALRTRGHILSSILAGIGLSISIWAMVTMGTSFGIAPADRGLVSSGPYRFLRHPMYTGELISVFGAVLGRWTVWNVVVLILLVITLVCRIRWEERIIHGYREYKGRVRWRMLPGAW